MCGTRVVIFFVCALVARVVCEDFNLLILHNNDMHARFEETELNSATCRPANRNRTCIGGFARTAHEIRRHRRQAQEGTGPPVIYLNAGDTFTGTVWYSVFTHNITAEMVNLLAPDAMCLGNHEFDQGVAELAPFVNKVTAPILAANLDFSKEPTLENVQPSTILEVAGKKIGIIGYLTTETQHISMPEGTIFLDEIESVQKEAENLEKQGINIIIALGHAGFLKDQEIAAKVPQLDVVVGGHTNTFLYNGKQPDLEPIEGPYPVLVTQASGKKVPVVQAYAYTKYLGRLNITFNENGDVTNFYGQPELLYANIPQENDILEAIEKYRPKIEEIDKEVVGISDVVLDGNSAVCRQKECVFGNLIADALVKYVESVYPKGTIGPIALVNGGGIRNTIDATDTNGSITRGELLGALPFGNQILTLKLKGVDLKAALEQGVRSNGETSRGEFLQVSGLKVELDWNRAPGDRVRSVQVRCCNSNSTTYKDINHDEYYKIATFSFLTGGGDGHTVLQKNGEDYKTEDLSDIDMVVWYFEKYSPVSPRIEGRIRESTGGSGAWSVRISGSVLLMWLISISCNFVT